MAPAAARRRAAAGELLAVEVVRALAGSIGIVAAVPLTTAVAAFLVERERGVG